LKSLYLENTHFPTDFCAYSKKLEHAEHVEHQRLMPEHSSHFGNIWNIGWFCSCSQCSKPARR